MQANWVKQLGKLLKVRSVEDITAHKRVGKPSPGDFVLAAAAFMP